MEYPEISNTHLEEIYNKLKVKEVKEKKFKEDEIIERQRIEGRREKQHEDYSLWGEVDETILNNHMNSFLKKDGEEDEKKVKEVKVKEVKVKEVKVKEVKVKEVNEIEEVEIKKSSRSLNRKNVDFNGMELVCAVLLKYPDITNYKELIKTIINIRDFPSNYPFIKFNSKNDISEYYNDVVKKNKIINKYITNFKKTIKNTINIIDITDVFVCGKSTKHIEINELNRNINRLDAKSDIYLKFTDGSMAGISVKQNKNATKSNYSVQKILGKDIDEYLSALKLEYLTSNGFPKFNKDTRSLVNKLFYPNVKDNKYMNSLKNEINKNSISIARILTSHLYCSEVPYDVYEFDGDRLKKINIKIEYNLIFEEHIPYYFNKKGIERKAAKLFYKLSCNEKNYRVEIRWKGSVYCSPQFHIHEE